MVKSFAQCNHAVFLIISRLIVMRAFYRKSSVCEQSIVAQAGNTRVCVHASALPAPADYPPWVCVAASSTEYCVPLTEVPIGYNCIQRGWGQDAESCLAPQTQRRPPGNMLRRRRILAPEHDSARFAKGTPRKQNYRLTLLGKNQATKKRLRTSAKWHLQR